MPTARQAIKLVYGQHTADFLGYCQKDYNGTPANAKKYSSYLDAPYADYIKNRIESALFEDYGYKAEDLKGYHFDSSAQVSKDMATNSDLTNWVKKNIKTIISPGIDVNNPGAMTFTSAVNEDLYLSIASATIIESKINGRNLVLTMFDIYDFDVNAKDGLNGTAAAAMLDGEIVPYYFTSEVKIDLTNLFTEQELKNLGL